jgi:hypothetical protein
MTAPQPCSGPLPLTRRQVLQIGAAGLLDLTLPRLLRASKNPRIGAEPAADHCIFVFLNGGPSHLDMWDMKPDAPLEIRGDFRPRATSVPGVQLCEHLAHLARQMHHCTLLRAVHHSVNNAHGAAVYTGLTGHDRGETGGVFTGGQNDHPAVGSVVGLCRPPQTPVVPFVSMPYITAEGRGGPPQPGFFGGWLGRAADPLFVLRNPNAPDFGMPEFSLPPDVNISRLDRRQELGRQLHQARPFHAERCLQDMDAFQARAFDLLTSPATQRAFRIDQEPAALRDSYGRNIYGQSILLARRLLEAGTRLACISWAPDANATWDTHSDNFVKLRTELLPQLDRAVGTLLSDLEARGMLERTLVAVMGEFGRSPRINAAAGRDHWNFCYSLLLAGGGVRGGYVHGASDRIGAQPSSHPVAPADVVATIYHCLGIPADLELEDRLHRPFQLVPWGSPIREVLA